MITCYDIIKKIHSGSQNSIMIGRDQINEIIICELIQEYRGQLQTDNFELSVAIHKVLELYLTVEEIECILKETM